MKLEVGKSYRCRDGSGPVKITMNHNIGKWCFLGSNGLSYREDGRYLSQVVEYGQDLVAKWGEPETKTDKPAKPDWYWGFWEKVFLNVMYSSTETEAAKYADAACAERMKREAQ